MRYLSIIYILTTSLLNAQSIDTDILYIQNRLDSIQSFSAEVKLNVDISFVNIPEKRARIEYQVGQNTRVFSEDFVLIPKKGLDVSLNQLFENPFITVDRGTDPKSNYKVVNIIPTNKKADFSIATVSIDTVQKRISQYEISTKKDGMYTVNLFYHKNSDVLPKNIDVAFEIERIRIPLKYMGKDAQIDKENYNSNEPKTGIIHLDFHYTAVTLRPISN
ncbi:hypothetical protein [Cognatitamlana onchidii]|uniref:hypothetical protein n=1 Tax=Cognatitamlana onchidii TaxID=2562860 RepID=UPI0010A62053|nr:hypothetical protein [Algibacter onchidii]